MHTDDWDAITLVTRWLKTFQSATTQISTTKLLMLSSAHSIFHGLQESLHKSSHTLPNSTPPCLKLGLTRAHQKLSDYFRKFDDSPHDTWSSCEWSFHMLCSHWTTFSQCWIHKSAMKVFSQTVQVTFQSRGLLNTHAKTYETNTKLTLHQRQCPWPIWFWQAHPSLQAHLRRLTSWPDTKNGCHH